MLALQIGQSSDPNGQVGFIIVYNYSYNLPTRTYSVSVLANKQQLLYSLYSTL